MRKTSTLARLSGVALGVLAGLSLQSSAASLSPAVNAIPRDRQCDRTCLYQVLDQYLAALVHKDPWSLPWSTFVTTSENNVLLTVGDGLWGTISGMGSYTLRMADPLTGQVAYFGAVNESGAISPMVIRLKVEEGRISEAETLVRRASSEGHVMAEPSYVDKPILNEVVPGAERQRRERLISVSNGYFDTLQLNDGTLFTKFDPHCNRVENGVQTTNNPALAPLSFTLTLGCAEQFKLGNFRYDDRLRARRFPLVDVERGLVLSSAFMDHEGRLDTYQLTDGRTSRATYHQPHTYYMLELFKIDKESSIQQIEAVFMSVPYHTRSVWTND
jgi:hypothetical protein